MPEEMTSPTETKPEGLATNVEALPGEGVVRESERPSEDQDDQQEAFMTLFEPPTETVAEPKVEQNPPTQVAGQQPAEEGKAPLEQQPVVQQVQSPPSGQPQQAANPAQGTQPVVQPAVQPQAPVQSQQPQAAPDTQEDEFVKLDKLIEDQRPKVIDSVALGAYQLTQEELEGISVEPEKVIPKLLAKVHVNAVQGVLRHVAQTLPQMLNGMLQVREVNRQREDTFWKAWPQLDRTKHSAQVMQAAQTFRQMNPKADEATFVKQVGAMVAVMNGLYSPPSNQPSPPQAARVPAFVPAGAGQTGGAPASVQQPQGWEVIAQMMSNED